MSKLLLYITAEETEKIQSFETVPQLIIRVLTIINDYIVFQHYRRIRY